MQDANDACESMCRKMGQYPNCQCPDMEPPDLTPGVVAWEHLTRRTQRIGQEVHYIVGMRNSNFRTKRLPL